MPVVQLHAARTRLATHYLQRLQDASVAYQQGYESAVHGMTVFERDLEQLRHWLDWASAQSAHDDAAAALYSKYLQAGAGLFEIRFTLQEQWVIFEAGLLAARRVGDRRAEALSCIELCQLSDPLGHPERALSYAQQALEFARQTDDRELLARALLTIGVCSMKSWRIAEAAVYLEESLALYRAIGRDVEIAHTLHQLGMLARYRGDMAAASDFYAQSLACYQEIGNHHGIADNLHDLAGITFVGGDYAEARRQLEHSIAIYQMLGHRKLLPFSWCNLGIIVAAGGDYTTAQGYFEQSLAQFQSLNNQEGVAYAVEQLAHLARRQEQYALASERYEQTIAVYRSMSHRKGLVTSLAGYVQTLLALDEPQAAQGALREGLTLALELGVDLLGLHILLAAIALELRVGSPSRAALWAGLADSHPRPDPRQPMRDDLSLLRRSLEMALTEEVCATIWQRGAQMDLRQVLTDLLQELQGP